jgi:hypothetical protein
VDLVIRIIGYKFNSFSPLKKITYTLEIGCMFARRELTINIPLINLVAMHLPCE